MDRKEIAAMARQMKTKGELLFLINRIKRDKMREEGLADKYYEFTIRHLYYYCNPNNQFHRYKQFGIKKKSGGMRQITAPRNQSFKLMLHYVNEIFKALYTPSDYAMGFAIGRSVAQNAAVHIGQNYVFNIDLKDFFPSIHQARVWKRLQLEPFCFNRSIANILAGLCSMKEKLEDGSFRYVLPQGAPTSPIITNMICDRLDHRLAGLAKRFGLKHSRYADDITFSSMHNVYQPEGDFRKELKRIIESQGFAMNESKTRLQKRGEKQEVTGIIVSDKLNVSQKYVRDIRNVLYIWEKYGYAIACNRFFHKYKQEKGHVKKGTPDMANVLEGKLLYLKMVKGDSDSVYIRLKSEFDKLAKTMRNPQKTTSQGVTYVETIPVLEFERKNETEVFITTSNPKADKPNYNVAKTEDGSFIPHRYAYFSLGGRKHKASVNKSLPKEYEHQKGLLSISCCRDSMGKLFWLIHRSDKVTVPPRHNSVDIDSLNRELDNFLSEA